MLTPPSSPSAEVATARWEALGTTVVLRVTNASALIEARALVEEELAAVDLACSRFRADSELERVNASAGRYVTVSPLLLEALEAALRAAALTDGAVDPTLGEAIVLAGYSRDFAELEHPPAGPAAPAAPEARAAPDPSGRPAAPTPPGACRPIIAPRRASGWKLIEIGYDPPGVRIPAGVRLDLGATAKALAADRAVDAVHAATGSGVLVSLGGDIATAGRPYADGWAIHLTDDHRSGPDAPGQTITIADGGLATSSTTARRWLRNGRVMHHILDPATGQPVEPVWRTASVAASSCVDANIATTAALVQGRSALAWLSELRLPARLVSVAGEVHSVAGWPDQPPGPES
jgi:thiamine biosynthesis lipoprotein